MDIPHCSPVKPPSMSLNGALPNSMMITCNTNSSSVTNGKNKFDVIRTNMFNESSSTLALIWLNSVYTTNTLNTIVICVVDPFASVYVLNATERS